jgi:hypothetical protein
MRDIPAVPSKHPVAALMTATELGTTWGTTRHACDGTIRMSLHQVLPSLAGPTSGNAWSHVLGVKGSRATVAALISHC